MRQIKYRQRNKNNGHWHYWGQFKVGEFIGPMTSDNHVPIEESNEFTGLLDKNGKEIFEGDILKDGKGQYGKVLWHFNSWLVEWQERGRDGHLLQDRMTDDCFGYGSVEGNIYENPELLDKKL